jgi:hypothetical protein
VCSFPGNETSVRTAEAFGNSRGTRNALTIRPKALKYAVARICRCASYIDLCRYVAKFVDDRLKVGDVYPPSFVIIRRSLGSIPDATFRQMRSYPDDEATSNRLAVV